MTYVAEWAHAVWETLALSGPWLIGGFFLAGLLHVVLPERFVHRLLGGDDARSVLRAAVLGAPLPLCSCSVLPTAVALRRAGTSRGATTSFLVATPETGVDSVGVTWALMDPLMTVARPLAAVASAIASGLAVNGLAARGDDHGSGGDALDPDPDTAACDVADTCHDTTCGHQPGDATADHDHDHDHDHGEATGGVLRRTLAYAFGPLLDDLTPWFLVGLALAGLVSVAVPDGFLADAPYGAWLGMAAMLVVGIPMYVCATASTPIAAALVVKGLAPGAALVFLLVGPATNMATMTVIRRFLGGRVLAVYLVSLVVVALACGVALDLAYGALGLEAQAVDAGAEHGAGAVEVAGGVVMAALLVMSLARRAVAASRARAA